MKASILKRVEVEVTSVHMALHVRYEEEDIPNDFPLRKGDMWEATVDIATGQIANWPQGSCGVVAMKVCDEGTYTLLGPDGSTVAMLEGEYVPNRLIPGEYGDYVDLRINEKGIITNWPRQPNIEAFFPQGDW